MDFDGAQEAAGRVREEDWMEKRGRVGEEGSMWVVEQAELVRSEWTR